MAEVAISVVMPVYNAGTYLGSAIESILNQTESRFEFLIFDDGSTDGSIDLLNRYARQDSRIKLRLENHSGYCVWLNQGIQEARGQFIARMDADDISLPDRLSLQRAFLEANSHVVAVGGSVLTMDEEGDPLRPWIMPPDHEQIDRNHLEGQTGGLIHPATMIRREAVLDVGGYRCDFEPAEDLDLWLRLAERGKLANLPDIVLHLRQHAASVSSTDQDKQRAAAERAISETRLRRHMPARPVALRNPIGSEELTRRRFDWSWGAGYHQTSRKYALRLIRHRPLSIGTWFRLAKAFLPTNIKIKTKQIFATDGHR